MKIAFENIDCPISMTRDQKVTIVYSVHRGNPAVLVELVGLQRSLLSLGPDTQLSLLPAGYKAMLVDTDYVV